MITAKCDRCGGAALGNSFEEASGKINHAVALSRGIKCGNNYNHVKEIKDSTPKKLKSTETPQTETKSTPQTETKSTPQTETKSTPKPKTEKSKSTKY